MTSVFLKFKLFVLHCNSVFFAILPEWLLYAIADVVAFILYYIVGYRKAVVRKNLLNSFPSKSLEEVIEIEKKFYRHLADLMLESMAIGGFSSKRMAKKMVYTNPELAHDSTKNSSCIVAIAHYGNWEFTIGFSTTTSNDVYAVYHPLKNKTMDEFYKRFRSKFGTIPLSMNVVPRQFATDYRENRHSLYALIADQTPVARFIKFRVMFLNQPTAFFTGMETLSQKYSLPILYLDIVQTKRGCYCATFTPLFDGKEHVTEAEITKRYATMLEKSILREPHLWLWSHKRWKHPVREGEVLV